MSEGEDVDLRELARLINVWGEHSWDETDEEVLATWILESATRTRMPPRFQLAWSLATRMNLVKPTSDNLVSPSESLLVCCSDQVRELDSFEPAMALLVFRIMLADLEFSTYLDQVISAIRFSPQHSTFHWSSVPTELRHEVGWVWLQQLGLLENDGDTVVVAANLLPYIAQSTPSRRPMSQEELEDRLAAQQIMAGLAEDYIVELEKDRLRKAEQDDLAEGVFRISIDDVEAGYDVLSFEVSGERRRIEVKSSVGPRRAFFISRNEIAKARFYAGSYWLAWLSFCERLPTGAVEVSWFDNPAAIFDHPDGPWEMCADRFQVTLVKDDSYLSVAH